MTFAAAKFRVGSTPTSPTVQSGASDPTTAGGVGAELGSLYQRTNGTLWIKIGVADIDWALLAPSGAPQYFTYVATGTEGTDFSVTIPTPRADDNYAVLGACSDAVAGSVGLQFPNALAADRTTTEFRVILTAILTVHDTIDFVVATRS